MESITKFWQSKEVLQKMTEYVLNTKIEDFAVQKLSGGFCSAVYLVEAE